jgi:DMSO/TMAO reductase YedYZ heme-binding membrane subunit
VARLRDGTPTITIVGGGIAYVFIALMTLTSFDRPRRWLGPRAWRGCTRTGAYYIWIIFAQSFFRMRSRSAIYGPIAALVAGAMAAALAARAARAPSAGVRRRRRG